MNIDFEINLLTRNRIKFVTPEDQYKLSDYLETIKAFARLTYQSIYVIDYALMKFEYVSSNPLFLCGYSVDEVMDMSYDFYTKTVTEEDFKFLNVINAAGFDFLEKQTAEEKSRFSITYDFHLQHLNGKTFLINHKLTPLFFNTEGKMWKAICLVSLSHHRKPGNVTIHKEGSSEVWSLNLSNKTWHKSSKARLNERELEVLRFYAQGFTINQIAERMFISPDTVKYYKRKIFENFNVSNTLEALSYAVNNKII